MRIIDCEQRSPEWDLVRRGVPTASEFGNVMTPVQMKYASAADEYINRLLDESFRPEARSKFDGNRHTQRGVDLEPDALEAYAFQQDVQLRRVGFVLNDAGTLGCSPDALVVSLGGDVIHHIDGDPCNQVLTNLSPGPLFLGGAECKAPDGPTHLKWMRAGGVPAEHKAQVHGSLIVTGLPWWDFVSYCPPYPLLIVRVVPDAFTEALRACLDRFLAELAKTRATITQRMEAE